MKSSMKSLALCSLLAGAACNPGPDGVGTQQSAQFVNGGFETGTSGQAPPAPFSVTPYLDPYPNGITIQSPQTYPGLNLRTTPQTTNGGTVSPTAQTHTLVSATGPLTQADPYMGVGASLRWPRYGNQCALVNENGRNTSVNELAQIMTVGAGDVDPADSRIHIRFVVAPVLENPGHLANQQPYFFIQLTNLTTGALLYSNFNFSNQAGVPWKTITTGGTTYTYTDWQLVDVSPDASVLKMGDQVKLQLLASGCSLGAHMGQLYVDGLGATIPDLFVSGTGPAQVNACDDITYQLSYKNGTSTAAAGVVLSFNTPPGTTFKSINAPGLVCTTPSVGAGGAVSCTIGALAAGAGGALSITVNVPCGTAGTVTAGNYSISQSGGTNPLLGPVINTIVGCTSDAQCTGGTWCNDTAAKCTARLANGTPIPTDAPHVNPPLNGTCTPAAATLVCASQVCDTTDDKCGYLNGDGSCNPGSAALVCRSAVCGADNVCGYPNGPGSSCNAGNAALVCRSGACSVNGTCRPMDGCFADGDCAGGEWCYETAAQCKPRLANGVAIPTDAPHMGPTLDGTCTTSVGALVCASQVCDTGDNLCGYPNGHVCTPATDAALCRSGVCDTDGRCGYADGRGTCTPATAATLCRSGSCSTNGACEPAGGCNVDADCSAGSWCNESAGTCTPQLANGTSLPTDSAHMNPTLDGTCTTAASALVCLSQVCDTDDNKCGYADGHGTCTPATAATVCRSGACSTNGACLPAGGCNVDADCATGNWCNESTHVCTPQLANGASIPTDPAHMSPTLNGTCTTAAGKLVCLSQVCDVDDKCGYADGHGTCTPTTAATVCRSGTCNANGACGPADTTDGGATDGGVPVDGSALAGEPAFAGGGFCTLGENGAPSGDALLIGLLLLALTLRARSRRAA